MTVRQREHTAKVFAVCFSAFILIIAYYAIRGANRKNDEVQGKYQTYSGEGHSQERNPSDGKVWQ